MESKEFIAALWGFNWDIILHSPRECEQGVVSFDNKSGAFLDIPFGQVLGDPFIHVLPPELALPESVDWLYGFAQDGTYLALKDPFQTHLSKSVPGGTHQTLESGQLLCSKKEFDPESAVADANLYLVGLREWFAQIPIEKRRDLNTGGLIIDADLRGKDHNVILLDDEECRIELVHHFAESSLSVSGVSIEHDCYLSVLFKAHPNLGEAEKTLFCIADFFSMCFGFGAEVKAMQIRFDSGDSFVDCYVPLVGNRIPKNLEQFRMPFPSKRIGESVSGCLRAWLHADAALSSCLALTVSLMFRSWEMPSNLRFIASTQLFEALSKYRVDTRSMPKDKFDSYKRTFQKAIRTIDDKDTREWALNLVGSNRKGQRRLIKEFLKRHEETASWLVGDVDAFVKVHIDERNRITHGDSKSGDDRSAEDLYWHTEVLLLLCYCSVLEAVGMDASFVRDSLERTSYKAHVRSKGHELYPSQSNG